MSDLNSNTHFASSAAKIFLASLLFALGLGVSHAQCDGSSFQVSVAADERAKPRIDRAMMDDGDGGLIPGAPSIRGYSTSSTYPSNRFSPCVTGRLTSANVGVVANQNDPYSVQVAEYYVAKRGISPQNVLWVSLPVKAELSASEFSQLMVSINSHFGSRVQALAVAWVQPFAVSSNGFFAGCNNSITAAITFGGYRELSCLDRFPAGLEFGSTGVSPYFNSASFRPFTDHGLRLSMLLAASNVNAAKALIDRGVNSDGTLGNPGLRFAHAHFLRTSDPARNIRINRFPSTGLVASHKIFTYSHTANFITGSQGVVFYLTGMPIVADLGSISFLPGGLGDSVTSYGGVLVDPTQNKIYEQAGQTSLLKWVDAGVTATAGTTSEPLAYSEKFSDPRVLFASYVQGSTAIEAYWRSVSSPRQTLFVGEPLAAPFGR